MLAALTFACGGGTHSSPDAASVEATTPAPVTDATPPADRSAEAVGPGTGGESGNDDEDSLLGGDEEEEDLFDYPPLEEWTEPEFGRTVMIASDCVIVALEGSWDQPDDEDLPIDIAPLDEAFESHPTVQNLISAGYELALSLGG